LRGWGGRRQSREVDAYSHSIEFSPGDCPYTPMRSVERRTLTTPTQAVKAGLCAPERRGMAGSSAGERGALRRRRPSRIPHLAESSVRRRHYHVRTYANNCGKAACVPIISMTAWHILCCKSPPRTICRVPLALGGPARRSASLGRGDAYFALHVVNGLRGLPGQEGRLELLQLLLPVVVDLLHFSPSQLSAELPDHSLDLRRSTNDATAVST
jgi:hypothetical protein